MDHHPAAPLALLLRRAHQAHAQHVEEALRTAGFDGITPAHANVFPFVPPDGIRVGEIAKLAGVRKQSTAEAVEQLERLGYLERRPDPSDRRARLVFLTERGEAVRPIARAAGQDVEQAWAKLTSPDEIEALRSALQRLVERID